jgi:hypothetical protein
MRQWGRFFSEHFRFLTQVTSTLTYQQRLVQYAHLKPQYHGPREKD